MIRGGAHRRRQSRSPGPERRRRRDSGNRFASLGVLEGEAPGVQGDSLFALVLAIRAERDTCPVLEVAEDRVPPRCRLQSNLVGATRLQLDFQPRTRFATSHRVIAKQGRPGTGTLRLDHLSSGLARYFAHRVLPYTLGWFNRPFHQGPVYLHHSPTGELFTEPLGGPASSAQDYRPRGRPVEPVWYTQIAPPRKVFTPLKERLYTHLKAVDARRRLRGHTRGFADHQTWARFVQQSKSYIQHEGIVLGNGPNDRGDSSGDLPSPFGLSILGFPFRNVPLQPVD